MANHSKLVIDHSTMY